MRVTCLATDSRSSSWLDIDSTYEVLEIYGYPNREIDFRVYIPEKDALPIFSSTMFYSADESIPTNWNVSVSEGGLLYLGPLEWSVRGFWDKYFDDDADAVESVNQVLRRLEL